MVATDWRAIAGETMARRRVDRLAPRELKAIYRVVTLNQKADCTGAASQLIGNVVSATPSGAIAVVAVAARGRCEKPKKHRTDQAPASGRVGELVALAEHDAPGHAQHKNKPP